MVSSVFLTGSCATKPVDHTLSSQSHLSKQLRSQLHTTASAMAMAAAGVSADLSLTLEANGALTSTLSCSPPRTYTRTSNFTHRMTVPTTCLAAAKTRRKKGRRGGGDEEIPDGDDGGSDGGSGGDDSGGGDWWNNEEDGGADGNGPRTILQDMVLLWGVFCAICFVQTVQHVTRRGVPRQPSGVLAALALVPLRQQ